ncbi:DUF4149 domain-containing protein [Oxynema sp. CENA135]|uniref:DUF4149 domain-containing protein n=1 Tax=Oxynema sp. CENA135 TaxID=984206 RepID=UPI00190A251A|nr:DUF4149 domain-containing protein [Oxynema sp. CENA135]MBK4732225.1 DUF4149 domain-containing protein [Oxynema sp. CENA135]
MAIIPTIEVRKPAWHIIAMFALGFWLSAIAVVDLVVMPTMYAAGMTVESGFASAGYVMFGTFNRIELLCAAVVLTGLLTMVYRHRSERNWGKTEVILSVILLGIVLAQTYALTPQMSALGIQLNWLDREVSVPAIMDGMHESYWFLELVKLGCGGFLLSWLYRKTKEDELLVQ